MKGLKLNQTIETLKGKGRITKFEEDGLTIDLGDENEVREEFILYSDLGIQIIRSLIDEMEYNDTGDYYYDAHAFNTNNDEVCYIPTLAETLDEVYSYNELEKECEEWASDNSEYMKEENITVGELTQRVWDVSSGEFPSTILEGFLLWD